MMTMKQSDSRYNFVKRVGLCSTFCAAPGVGLPTLMTARSTRYTSLVRLLLRFCQTEAKKVMFRVWQFVKMSAGLLKNV